MNALIQTWRECSLDGQARIFQIIEKNRSKISLIFFCRNAKIQYRKYDSKLQNLQE